ncbi:hypothetical protein B0H19DRAFT_1254154 [Mycena capillaripes]|nr:hypothetical protein B0H19DRAFT_1254154 [Mycena capillaripes]
MDIDAFNFNHELQEIEEDEIEEEQFLPATAIFLLGMTEGNPRFQPPILRSILRSDPRILRSDPRSDLRYPPTFPPPSQTPSGRIPALRMALRM